MGDFMKNSRIRAFYKEHDGAFYTAAFLIPAVILLAAYIAMGIAPFGKNSILTMDLWGQYFPMIKNTKDVLFSGEALHSFDGALGYNSLAQSAYYSNSPFWLVIALLPGSFAVYLINYLVLIKISLASVFMAHLLRSEYGKFYLFPALGGAYALSAYVLAFYSQTIWHDAVMLLPLVVLGFLKTVRMGRPYLYFISLSLVLFSNFYVGFMVCIFLVLLFLAWAAGEAKSFRGLISSGLRFSLYSLLAAGLCCAVLLPTYMALNNTLASTLGWGGVLKIYHSLTELLASFMPVTDTSVEYGVPNIYCSLLAIALALLFILTPKIPLRKRLAFSALSLFLLLSLNINLLDFIWHGFHYPNQLPGRESFILCFMLIFMAAEAFTKIEDARPAALAIPFLLLFAGFVLFYFKAPEVGAVQTLFCALLGGGYFALLCFYVFKKDGRAKQLIALLLVLETGVNAVCIMARDVGRSSIPSYSTLDTTMAEIKEKYGADSKSFYRAELLPHWTFEPGMLYGYSGVSYYSSTMSAGSYDFLRSLGNAVYAKNVSSVYRQNPVLNALFGVKYIYDRNSQNDSWGLHAAEEIGGVTVRENEYCLPIGFKADVAAAELSISPENNSFTNLNSLFSALSGAAEVFGEKTAADIKITNASLLDTSNGQYYSRTDKSKPAEFYYKFTADEDAPYYFACNFKYGKLGASVNGEVLYSMNLGYQDIKYLGELKKGDTVEIELISQNNYAQCGIELYAFNTGEFKKGYAAMSEATLENAVVKGGKISGTTDSEAPFLMALSVAADSGWTVKIDGKAVPAQSIASYLLSFEVPAGEHEIELSYSPEGFKTGLAVSVGSAVLAAAFYVYEKKRRKEEKA